MTDARRSVLEIVWLYNGGRVLFAVEALCETSEAIAGGLEANRIVTVELGQMEISQRHEELAERAIEYEMRNHAKKYKDGIDLERKARALLRAQERAKKKEIVNAVRARAIGTLVCLFLL